MPWPNLHDSYSLNMYYLVYRLIFIMQIKTIKWHIFTALQKYLCILDFWLMLIGKSGLVGGSESKHSRRTAPLYRKQSSNSGHLMGFAGDFPKSVKLRPNTFSPLKFYNWIPKNLPYFIVFLQDIPYERTKMEYLVNWHFITNPFSSELGIFDSRNL